MIVVVVIKIAARQIRSEAIRITLAPIRIPTSEIPTLIPTISLTITPI